MFCYDHQVQYDIKYSYKQYTQQYTDSSKVLFPDKKNHTRLRRLKLKHLAVTSLNHLTNKDVCSPSKRSYYHLFLGNRKPKL